jgi:hypothetical protein
MRRARRLRRCGSPVWALAVPGPASVDQRPGGPPGRTLLQYTLADGRVVERISPRPTRKTASLRPGQQVLVWYDPEDPQDVLVCGREGMGADLVFVTVGAILILAGAGIAALGG